MAELVQPQLISDQPRRIAARYGRLLDEGVLSDVTFIVGKEGKCIGAHKAFLASASVVFKEMFLAEPSKTEFEAQDVESDIFQIILRHVYSQSIEEYLRPEERGFKLLSAAVHYGLDDLAEQVKTSLKLCISKDTALKFFKLAILYKDDHLEKAALQEICRSAHKILTSKEFLDLDIPLLERIIALDDLAAKDEVQIFEALIRWAWFECFRKELFSTRNYYGFCLEKVIPLVRFPLMSKSDFENRVLPRGILTFSEEVRMWLYYETPAASRSNVLAKLEFSAKPRNYYRANTGRQCLMDWLKSRICSWL